MFYVPCSNLSGFVGVTNYHGLSPNNIAIRIIGIGIVGYYRYRYNFAYRYRYDFANRYRYDFAYRYTYDFVLCWLV